jgi:carbon storage regulator
LSIAAASSVRGREELGTIQRSNLAHLRETPTADAGMLARPVSRDEFAQFFQLTSLKGCEECKVLLMVGSSPGQWLPDAFVSSATVVDSDGCRGYHAMEGASMLVLSRRVGERVEIGGGVVVVVTAVRGEQVQLGFECPREIPIWRPEASSKRSSQRPEAAETVSSVA